MSQIPELLEMIASLKQKRISGEAVAFDWMKRRIQPLQARVTFGFEYWGKNDPSRCSEEEISNGEALRRVQRLFEKVEHVPHLLNTFSVLNPPKEVSDKYSICNIEYFIFATDNFSLSFCRMM